MQHALNVAKEATYLTGDYDTDAAYETVLVDIDASLTSAGWVKAGERNDALTQTSIYTHPGLPVHAVEVTARFEWFQGDELCDGAWVEVGIAGPLAAEVAA